LSARGSRYSPARFSPFGRMGLRRFFFTACRERSTSVEPMGWRSELYGENWTSNADRSFETDKLIQDFSQAGYAMNERPLPELADAPVFDAVAAFGADPTGETDSTLSIQRALDAAAAAGGGIVYLPPGRYRIAPLEDQAFVLRISASGVVLRGAGPEQTFLLNTATFMRGKSILMAVGAPEADWSRETEPVVPLTKELPGPTRLIPVADTAPFQAGDWIVIRSEATRDWILEHGEEDWLPDEGKIGSFRYLRRVLKVHPAERILQIDIPTRYSLKPRDRARVYRKSGFLREVGLEGFAIGNLQHPGTNGWGSLDFVAPDGEYTRRLIEAYGITEEFVKTPKSAYDVHGSYAIRFSGIVDGWIRNVSTFRPEENSTGAHLLSNGIVLRECRNVTVQDCVFQWPQYGGGGGNGYMYRISDSNDCLLERCTAAYSRHGYSISGMSASGNVLHRCADRYTSRQTGATGDERTGGRGSDHHMWFSHSNLIDACEVEDSWFEARYRGGGGSRPRHNITSAHTVYWNTLGISNSFHPFCVWSDQGRYGYVIGTRGARPEVETGPGTGAAGPTAPIDHVEGVGQGETLIPFSLFEDQIRRRLSDPDSGH
ncbi:MAG: glycosyl hydrolase family 28-related protein, partial [Kiritimatiellia bacterium]|nr:glycosyl hydrolase family 28-related protein [Kiritimatiellia bacterium]